MKSLAPDLTPDRARIGAEAGSILPDFSHREWMAVYAGIVRRLRIRQKGGARKVIPYSVEECEPRLESTPEAMPSSGLPRVNPAFRIL
jgi:hypothetical protein